MYGGFIMVYAKSIDVRDNFKSWCGQVADGEIIQISRPGNNFVYMINQETYEKLSMEKRMATYTSYIFGKDKLVNLKRLSEIEKLPDNWNNNGAEHISPQIIKMARKLLMSMTYQPEVFPTACEAIQLEWENDKKEYLEMEILDGTINIFQIDAEGGEEQHTISFDENIVNAIVEEFYDRIV